MMEQLIVKLVFGCLNCDKPIPMKIAQKGKQICSKKCLKELNKNVDEKFHFGLDEVWKPI